MTTRSKLNLASLTASAMMLLNVFSGPLGISRGGQWVLILGVFVPLWLAFVYSKKLKGEVSGGAAMPSRELSAAEKKIRARLIMAWIWCVAFSLASPFWLPVTGASLGTGGDFLVGIATAAALSVIFAIRLKKRPNQTPEPTPMSVTPPAAQEPRQP